MPFDFGRDSRRAGVAAAEDDVGFGKVGPATVFVEAGESADGANDGGGAYLHGAPLLDELFDDPASVLAAKNIEASGAGVTINGICICELEITANEVDALPLDVRLLDKIDVRAAAELAFAAMAFKAGDGGFAFGDFRFGGARERATRGRGRGEVGGGLGSSALVGFGLSLLGGDEREIIGDGRKAVRSEPGIVVGTAFEEDIVEAGIDDEFWRGVVGHVYISPFD